MPVVAGQNCQHDVRVPADIPVGGSVRCPRCTITFSLDVVSRRAGPVRRRGGLPVWAWVLIAIPLLTCPCVGGIGLIGYLASREQAKPGGMVFSRDDTPVTNPDTAWDRARGRWVSRGPDASELVLEFTEQGQRHVRSTVQRPGFRESRGFTVMAIEMRGDGRFVLKAPQTNNAEQDAKNDLGAFWFEGGRLVRQPADGGGPIRYDRDS